MVDGALTETRSQDEAVFLIQPVAAVTDTITNLSKRDQRVTAEMTRIEIKDTL